MDTKETAKQMVERAIDGGALYCPEPFREVAQAYLEQEKEIQRLREALQKIADTDYRGNRSNEQVIAHKALKGDNNG